MSKAPKSTPATENKIKPRKENVTQFIASIEDAEKRSDCTRILELMKKHSGEEPVMWGAAMVGFGMYRYKYASGREGDWFKIGFSPRKQNISLYFTCGFGSSEKLLKKLGKYKTGKSCLYIDKIADVDVEVLEELIVSAYG